MDDIQRITYQTEALQAHIVKIAAQLKDCGFSESALENIFLMVGNGDGGLIAWGPAANWANEKMGDSFKTMEL